MSLSTQPRRKIVFLTLIATGLVLVSTAAMTWLIDAQGRALEAVSPLLPPAVSSYPAPALHLSDLAGNTVSLQDFPGQVVLVNNWATWCPPCQSEMPALEAYYQAHAQEGLVVLAIEAGEPAEEVAAFAERYALTFPILLDPEGDALEAFQNWNLPSTYIIDRRGTVVLSWTGEINRDTLEQYVTPLLER